MISPVQPKTGRMGYFRAIMTSHPKKRKSKSLTSFRVFFSSFSFPPLHLFPTFRLLNPYVFGKILNLPSPPSTARNCWSYPSPRNCAESKFPPWRSNLRNTQNKREMPTVNPNILSKKCRFLEEMFFDLSHLQAFIRKYKNV